MSHHCEVVIVLLHFEILNYDFFFYIKQWTDSLNPAGTSGKMHNVAVGFHADTDSMKQIHSLFFSLWKTICQLGRGTK